MGISPIAISPAQTVGPGRILRREMQAITVATARLLARTFPSSPGF
ncbi:MAG: hypothetical protein WCQ50_19340 [Spirochaetota bacterium]